MCIRSYWNPSLSAKQHEIIWWFGVFDGVLLLLSLLVLFLFCFLESGGSKGGKILYFTAICTQFRAVIQVKELGNVLKHYTVREQTQTKCKGTILDRYTAACQDQNLV